MPALLPLSRSIFAPCLISLNLLAATLPAQAQAVAALPRLDAPLLLLGEVHDNAEQHRLRLQALQALVDQGARPALLLEMFDRDHQAAIDAVQQAEGPPAQSPSDSTLEARVDALITAGGRDSGWHWPFYRPYLRLALQYQLTVMAANVSRADVRRVVQLGLAATGFDPDIPADILRAQAEAIEQSHCGMMNAAAAARLATAQVARDQFMARLATAQAGRGVLLLAGNGHVRRDIGVPRWLPVALRGRSHAVGYLETEQASGEADADTAAFDEILFTKPQPREDPCAALRARPTAAAASSPR